MVPAALLHGPSLARLVLVLLAGLAVGLAEFMAKPVECVARGLRGGVGINLQGDADPTVPQDLHRHPRMDVKGGQICRKGPQAATPAQHPGRQRARCGRTVLTKITLEDQDWLAALLAESGQTVRGSLSSRHIRAIPFAPTLTQMTRGGRIRGRPAECTCPPLHPQA